MVLVLWQVTGSLFLLGLVELGLRAWAPAPEPDGPRSEDILELDPILGWRLKPGFDGPAFGARRHISEDGLQTIDTEQAHGTRPKVLVFGDSRSFGNGVRPDQTYAEVLDSQLPAHDVINLAVPGYSSYQGLAALRLALPLYRPDLVIFAFGFNDRRSVLGDAAVDGTDTFLRNARRRRLLDAARNLRLFTFLLGYQQAEGRSAPPAPIEHLHPRVSPDSYAFNISAAAELSRRAEAKFLLLLMRDAPSQSEDLDLGYGLAKSNRWVQAQAHLERAVDADNVFSDAARILLSQLRARQNLPYSSTIPSPVVSVFGGRPLLPQAPYLSAAREFSAVDAQDVVDVGPWLDAHPDVFYDFCHFLAPGHEEIARRLLGRIKENPANHGARQAKD